MNRPRSRGTRRAALVAASTTLVACATLPNAAPSTTLEATALLDVPPAPVQPAIPEVPVVVVAPAPVAPAPPPKPALYDLGVDQIVQPFWAAEGDRILYYDQPAPGLGGTWAVDPVTGKAARERPQWGNYVANGSLLVEPRPAQRHSYILHLPTGREWALPTTNSMLFTPDATMVAYNAAAQTTGGGGGGGNFSTTTLTISWADGQNAQRFPLPINGSAQAWLPGRDGSPNGRLLINGRRARQDHPALWVLDVRGGTLVDLFRSRRLVGVLPSPDGRWVVAMAMWNADQAQNGLWLVPTDGAAPKRLDFLGGYRWTADNRLIVIPVRDSGNESHEVWELTPANGELRRLTDGAETPFRIANFDWDVSPDGEKIVFVSEDTRHLHTLMLPPGVEAPTITPPAASAPPGPARNGKPYRLPFALPPGPSTWYLTHWYGVTTGGYRGRNSAYREGQGIHFGIDFAAPVGTPVVAIASGRVLAVDGFYGSPPHNVVLQLPDGNHIVYGHLVEPSRHVRAGQPVEAGQVIGNTGDSSSPYDGFGNPHLHLEIRKGGRGTATNLVPIMDANWHDLPLGLWPGPRFERDLDNPRRHQFIEEQPDIWFGGPIITNFTRPWPP